MVTVFGIGRRQWHHTRRATLVDRFGHWCWKSSIARFFHASPRQRSVWVRSGSGLQLPSGRHRSDRRRVKKEKRKRHREQQNELIDAHASLDYAIEDRTPLFRHRYRPRHRDVGLVRYDSVPSGTLDRSMGSSESAYVAHAVVHEPDVYMRSTPRQMPDVVETDYRWSDARFAVYLVFLNLDLPQDLPLDLARLVVDYLVSSDDDGEQ